MDTRQSSMLKKLMEMSFVLLEISLYLDTHPHDKRALAIHNNVSIQHKNLRDKYTDMYGPLSISDENKDTWQYIQTPWPWDYDFS
ncbi:MAG: spore coat protein CotJB [Anaeromicrobium sp.]|uniref:spore coat protein CotJB n=1 Tax=Anaeromicrobium sp. TaxID=1929132 RepID=UPI0025FD9B24|nr:spore coat protein CotJB [Anaeromicrobium sp.]MCT4595906.1 spore coat protein CotJB [Anaeromicrobium sp.]